MFSIPCRFIWLLNQAYIYQRIRVVLCLSPLHQSTSQDPLSCAVVDSKSKTFCHHQSLPQAVAHLNCLPKPSLPVILSTEKLKTHFGFLNAMGPQTGSTWNLQYSLQWFPVYDQPCWASQTILLSFALIALRAENIVANWIKIDSKALY